MKHIIVTVDHTPISMLASSTIDALLQALDLFPAAARITAKVSA